MMGGMPTSAVIAREDDAIAAVLEGWRSASPSLMITFEGSPERQRGTGTQQPRGLFWCEAELEGAGGPPLAQRRHGLVCLARAGGQAGAARGAVVVAAHFGECLFDLCASRRERAQHGLRDAVDLGDAVHPTPIP